MKGILLSLAVLIILGTCVRAQQLLRREGFPIRTTVQQGTVEGIYSTATGVRHYLGLPFAAPPVGDLRWRAPQPAATWEGVREATEFGPRPVQKRLFADMRFRSGMSEDCLYLNVWTPAEAGEALPVLLYFHGGGNVAGSGDELRYDGEYLASQGVVVVTANYRLGVFGFLAHPELSAETDHGSGNYGLLDQVAALEWVRANATAFGGDPDRITIGGESAGSIDCSMLMASPLSRDLIAGVFAQSGAALYGGAAPQPLAEVERMGEAFLQATGLPDLEALRAAPTSVVYEAQYTGAGYGSPTTVDGRFLTEPPLETYREGDQAKVPLLIGWTSAETAWIPAPESAEAYEMSVRGQFGDRAGDVLALYPAEDYARSNLALSSDNWIVLGTWKWADLHSRTGDSPVYRWRFDRIRPPLRGETRSVEPLGAGHATDIEYFFNTLAKSDAYAWEAEDRTVAQSMSAAVANFVRSGNPNGEGLPQWQPLVPGKTAMVFRFDVAPAVAPAANDARYLFLESLRQ